MNMTIKKYFYHFHKKISFQIKRFIFALDYMDYQKAILQKRIELWKDEIIMDSQLQ